MRLLSNTKAGDPRGLLQRIRRHETTYDLINEDKVKHRRHDKENRQKRSPTPISSGLYRMRSQSRSPNSNDEKDDWDMNDSENNNYSGTPLANSTPIGTIENENENENQLLMGALNNFGNSCYLNAVLYALRFTPSFLHYVHHFNENLEVLFGVKTPSSELSENACAHTVATAEIASGGDENGVLVKSNEHLVFAELHGVFAKLTAHERMHKNEPIEATSLQLAVREINNNFTTRTQQDSHEFLMCVLNCLRDSSDGLMHLANDKPDIFQKLEGNVESLLSFDYFHENFTGKSQSVTYCFNCESEQNGTPMEVLDLIVPLTTTNLDENFIEKFCLSTDKISGKYDCPKCAHHTEARRFTLYPKLPRILIVQLSRFDNYMNKVKTATPTPLTLNCFCTACIESRKNNDKMKHEYHLYGMIVHLGRTPKSGHYMAYVRSLKAVSEARVQCESTSCCQINAKLMNSNENNDTATDNNWYICDDEKITIISQIDFDEKIKNEATLQTPYILFYVRNDIIEAQHTL